MRRPTETPEQWHRRVLREARPHIAQRPDGRWTFHGLTASDLRLIVDDLAARDRESYDKGELDPCQSDAVEAGEEAESAICRATAAIEGFAALLTEGLAQATAMEQTALSLRALGVEPGDAWRLVREAAQEEMDHAASSPEPVDIQGAMNRLVVRCVREAGEEAESE